MDSGPLLPTVPVATGAQELSDALKPILARLDAIHATTLFQALGPERILDFAAFDTPVRMYLPFGATDVIQRTVLTRRTFFEAGLLAQMRELVVPGSVVADIGANIGNHSLFFAKICGAGLVYAFEPMRVTFSILERNIALNGLTNVHCTNAALGAREGRVDLLHFPEHNIGAARLRAGSETGTYPVTTLDAQRLPRLDFVKIDVEGSQLQVLEGAKETLRRCRPLVWIELRAKLGEYEPGDEAMRRLGYRQLRQMSSADFLYGP